MDWRPLVTMLTVVTRHRGQRLDLPGGGVTGLDGLHSHQGREVISDGVLESLDTLVVLKHFDGGRMDQGKGFNLKVRRIRIS